MKKYLKVLSLLLAFVITFTACSSTSTKAVAKVGTQTISYEDYLKRFALSKLQLDMYYGESLWSEKMPNSDKTILEQFKSDVLDMLIDQNIMLQEAKNKGITVDEDEIKKDMEQYKKNLESNEVIKKYNEDNKLDDVFIEAITRENLLQRALEDKYLSENPITDEEIDKYYKEHKADYDNEQVKASHILLKTTDENGKDMTQEQKEEVKAKIEEVYSKILAGENFEELAKKYSQDGSKDQGGDLGYFSRGAMVKPFEEVAFSLNIGDISKPFETQYGYHIVKLYDKQEKTISDEQIKEYIKTELEGNAFSKYIDELKAKTEIKKYEDVISKVEKDIKSADLSSLKSNLSNKEDATTEQEEDKEQQDQNTDKK